MDLDYFSQLTYPFPVRTSTGGGGDLDPAGLIHPPALCPQLRAVHGRHSGMALRQLRGPRGPLVPGGGGARGLRPERAPRRLAGAPQLFDLDNGRVPKMMRELVEGGGQPTVEELLEKWDEGREEEEEEQQEEQGA